MTNATGMITTAARAILVLAILAPMVRPALAIGPAGAGRRLQYHSGGRFEAVTVEGLVPSADDSTGLPDAPHPPARHRLV